MLKDYINESEISFYNIARFMTVTLKIGSDRSPRPSHQKVYLPTTRSQDTFPRQSLKSLDYDTRLSKLKLLSLSNRRFTRDVTLFFNVINGHYDIDISNKLIFCNDRNTDYNLRKNDTQDLVPNFSRTDGFKYGFFNRTVNEWNGLPNHIRE